jgi:hypothetical protein
MDTTFLTSFFDPMGGRNRTSSDRTSWPTSDKVLP